MAAVVSPAVKVAAPRGMVFINNELTVFESFSVDNNTRYQADQFRLRAPIGTDRKTMASRLDYWASLQDVVVVIWAGTPRDPVNYGLADLTRLIVGRVDELDINPAKNCVELYGRDLSADLIDTKTVEKWPNKRASDIAAIIAARHDLDAAIVPTTALVSSYFNNDFVSLQDDRSEWDMLTFLAQQEGYAVYVEGTTLHFEPDKPAPDRVYTLNCWYDADGLLHSDAARIAVTRNLTLARDIRVTVRAYDPGNPQRSYSVSAERPWVHNALNPPKGNTPPQVYTVNRPSMARDTAQRLANQLLADLSSKEQTLELDMPADTALTPQSLIRLQGAGELDCEFKPVSVQRTLSMKAGFAMRVQAKTQLPAAAAVSL